MPDPTAALAELTTIQDDLDQAEATATAKAAKRDQAMGKAREAGATWPQIEQATGLSNTRVGQILRRVSTAATTTT